MGPTVLLKVYGIAVNTKKNTQELGEETFYCNRQLEVEMKGSPGEDLVSHGILSGYLQHLSSLQY